jgi:hypothetical protein
MSLAQALSAAGYRSARARLEEIVVRALAENSRSFDGVRAQVMLEASKDAALLVVLFERWQRPAIDALVAEVAAKRREAERAKSSGARHPANTAFGQPLAAGGSSSGGSSSEASAGANTMANMPQRSGQKAGPTQADREAARADVIRILSKLDTVLINKRPIGDCTPEQAYEWADSQSRQARFARMLASNLPPGIPIRRSITPDEANELWERAMRLEGTND